MDASAAELRSDERGQPGYGRLWMFAVRFLRITPKGLLRIDAAKVKHL